MKIKNQEVLGPMEDILVLPRAKGDIVFKFKSISSFDEFEKLYPEPPIPWILKPNEPAIQNVKDPDYQKSLIKRSAARVQWLILKSMEDTDGLVWDSVDMSNSSTWGNLNSELEQTGFTRAERDAILGKALEVNTLDQTKLDAAKRRFLATQGEEESGQVSQ